MKFFCLLEASMGHGGAELLCKYTFILGRSEGEELAVNGGGSWPRFTAQQGRSTTVLQAPPCLHQQRAELPPKARQLRQPESGGDSTLSVLLKLKEIDCIREVGGRSDYRI